MVSPGSFSLRAPRFPRGAVIARRAGTLNFWKGEMLLDFWQDVRTLHAFACSEGK